MKSPALSSARFFRVSVLSLFVAVAGLTAASAQIKVESWTNLDGQKMEAEFLGRKGDYVTFRKADGSRYMYPYSKLSEEDRARVDGRSATAAVAADGGSVAKPEAPVAAAAPTAPVVAKPGKVAAALQGQLVQTRGSRLVSVDKGQLEGNRFLAFYYSAQWCPPCRAFTPELVEAYAKIKAKHPEFELVFVSSDQNEDAMKKYMTEYKMSFPALKFDQKGKLDAVRRPAHERGIPNLVFMDSDGKEIAVSYTPDGGYRGPRSVLAQIMRQFGI